MNVIQRHVVRARRARPLIHLLCLLGFGLAAVLPAANAAGTDAAAALQAREILAFKGAEAGYNPRNGVVRDSAGNLVGVMELGGLYIDSLFSTGGVLYRVDPQGNEKVLHQFSGGRDGATPIGRPFISANGEIYGTTQHGGSIGRGTVWRRALDGTLTVLHSFDDAVGVYPEGGVVQLADGSLVGMTAFGGPGRLGTVYRIDPVGAFTVLYAFSGADGALPVGELLPGPGGALYGATSKGGAFDFGTLFRLEAGGRLSTLHSFDGHDGGRPGTLIRGRDGALYGTTLQGGPANLGTLFRLAPDGRFTTLHAFDGEDGAYPSLALLQASDGALYGATSARGALGAGTLFRVSARGRFKTLQALDGEPAYGYRFAAPLIETPEGELVGTTEMGGRRLNCVPGCGRLLGASRR